jgi:signal transduction histidine kinase
MVLTWGPELLQFYNDAYSKLIGDKHPTALGGDIRVTLAEGWDTLGPMITKVMSTGIANWTPALLLVLDRAGYREEAYFSVSHAPAEDDTGEIVGMLAVCSEVTQQVLGERRLRLLRDLAFTASEARDVEVVCRDLAAVIAQHPLDVPFALIYLREPHDHSLNLCETVGLEGGQHASPNTVDLDAVDDAVWPFAQAVAGESVVIENVERRATLLGGPWNEPVRTALALPIATTGTAVSGGVLIVGINPNRALDEGYRSFYELLGGQVSVAIRNTQAYAEERQRAEALAQLDRAKTEFFSNVSHEFRTPLTLMLGPVEDMLTRAHTFQPRDLEQLSIIHRNGLRLLKLVNTLLDFSRVEARRVEALYQPTDLATFTADLASSFRSTIERAGLAFIVDCPPLSEPVYVDHDMWETLLFNLLSNAYKFTLSGQIEVTLREMEHSVTLSVRDTGIGIPAASLPHIFERFHRVRGTRGRSYEGTGIGLALVHELVRRHGGDIRVESTVGQGTTFTVTVPRGNAHLPADQVRDSASTAPRAKHTSLYIEEAARWQVESVDNTRPLEAIPPSLRSREQATPPQTEEGHNQARILLADDNADMRDYVQRLLSDTYLVEVVTNGVEALRRAQEQPPDLVVSDIMMPEMDGFTLLHELRVHPQTAHVPVILLSARAGEESTVEGLDAGADDYLVKPFSARELRARVRTHLELARARRRMAEEHAMRLAAEAAVRERDTFLTLASHELKTPLTSIQGFAALIDRRAQQDSRMQDRDRQATRVIVNQARRLNNLVTTMLDLSRIHTGQFSLDRGSVDMGALVKQIASETQIGLERHTIICDTPDTPTVVLGDVLRLEQVLQNLLQNAVKYSPNGGEIYVRVEQRSDTACLEVRDQGIGIPPNELPHLFERFYRATNADPGQISGLGIGLFVVHEIVTRHGGTLHVQSEEGQGSTFTVCLPLQPLKRNA